MKISIYRAPQEDLTIREIFKKNRNFRSKQLFSVTFWIRINRFTLYLIVVIVKICQLVYVCLFLLEEVSTQFSIKKFAYLEPFFLIQAPGLSSPEIKCSLCSNRLPPSICYHYFWNWFGCSIYYLLQTNQKTKVIFLIILI